MAAKRADPKLLGAALEVFRLQIGRAFRHIACLTVPAIDEKLAPPDGHLNDFDEGRRANQLDSERLGYPTAFLIGKKRDRGKFVVERPWLLMARGNQLRRQRSIDAAQSIASACGYLWRIPILVII